MTHLQLTLPQRRALYSSLRLFEKSLLEADEMLQSRDTMGTLYVRKTTMAPENIRQVRQKIAEALSAVSQMARRLEFTPGVDSSESIIMAEMNIGWENLEECQSQRMRGYGELDPQTMQELDPAMRRLANMALDINQLITESTPLPATPRKPGYLKDAG